MPPTKVAEFLEKWRKDHGLSKAAFADKLGFPTRQRYTQVLNGNPDLKTIRQMASALKVTVSELIGEVVPPPEESEAQLLKTIIGKLDRLLDEMRSRGQPREASGDSQ